MALAEPVTPNAPDPNLGAAFALVEAFSRELTNRCSNLEFELAASGVKQTSQTLAKHGIAPALFDAALRVKQISGRVNDLIHAVGMLLLLPKILEPDEVIETLSLASGSTGRDYDLQTNLRVAEFKFIQWRGGAETIRQNVTFVDLYRLAEHDSQRRRCLYVGNRDIVYKFFTARRKIDSVLSRRPELLKEFRGKYGDRFTVVSDYYRHVASRVDLIDMTKYLPLTASEALIEVADSENQ